MTRIPLQVHQFPCRSDNYGYLVHDPATGQTAAIDTPESAAVFEALEHKGWNLSHILNTHHHYDHVEGNLELKKKTGCTIIAGALDGEKIPGIDRSVSEGELVSLGEHSARVLETPGHTLGHVVYHFEDSAMIFTGDTLFSLGCGRLFEGSAAQMWNSLQKLMVLPRETRIYCAHEYTLANADFALHLEPGNLNLQHMSRRARKLQDEGRPTIPTTLGEECEANPFLRPHSMEIRQKLGLPEARNVDVFAQIRREKDQF